MGKLNKTKISGFTLIEIVIVLAIAALIMVIVFLAVQGAQRSRRDTQRKSDLNRMVSQLESFASSHQGKYPANNGGSLAAFGNQWNGSSNGNSFVAVYLNSLNNFKDPSTGNNYSYITSPQPINSIAVCGSGTGNQKPSGSQSAGVSYATNTDNTQYQIRICLENGEYLRDSANP